MQTALEEMDVLRATNIQVIYIVLSPLKYASLDNISYKYFRIYLSKFQCYTFLKIGIVGDGVQLGPLGTAVTNGLLCQPRVIMMMEKLVEQLAGEPKYSEKTCSSAALSTTNPTYCPDANPSQWYTYEKIHCDQICTSRVPQELDR
jgi:hypothetical protein